MLTVWRPAQNRQSWVQENGIQRQRFDSVAIRHQQHWKAMRKKGGQTITQSDWWQNSGRSPPEGRHWEPIGSNECGNYTSKCNREPTVCNRRGNHVSGKRIPRAHKKWRPTAATNNQILSVGLPGCIQSWLNVRFKNYNIRSTLLYFLIYSTIYYFLLFSCVIFALMFWRRYWSIVCHSQRIGGLHIFCPVAKPLLQKLTLCMILCPRGKQETPWI